MRFLVDEPLPPALCRWLIRKGHQADHVYRQKLRSRPDHLVRDRAVRDGAIVVTKDEDYRSLARAFGGLRVLWIRIGNTSNRVLLTRLEEVWPEVVARFEAGETIVPVDQGPPSP